LPNRVLQYFLQYLSSVVVILNVARNDRLLEIRRDRNLRIEQLLSEPQDPNFFEEEWPCHAGDSMR
jgi:hypothetical protein